MIKKLTLALAVGGILLLGPAQATEILSYTPANGYTDFVLTNNGATNSLTVNNAAILVTLFNANGIANGTTYQANLTISSDSSNASGSVSSGNITQPLYQNGFFSILLTSGPYAGQTLISGYFGENGAANTSISGVAGQNTTATLSSTDAVSDYSEVTFNTTFWNIASASQSGIDALIFNMTNITNLALTNGTSGKLDSFYGAASTSSPSTLSATLVGAPPPPPGAAPEPGTMGLLGIALVGLGLVGRKTVRR